MEKGQDSQSTLIDTVLLLRQLSIYDILMHYAGGVATCTARLLIPERKQVAVGFLVLR